MSNKEEYKEIRSQHPEIPVFSQYWWMNASCGDNWDVFIFRDKNNTVVATMPYAIFKKMGFTLISQHEFSQHSGPFIFYPDSFDANTSAYKKLSFEEKIYKEIISQLATSGADMFWQNFSPRITNHLPFHWAGYKQYTRYTYRLPNIGDSDELFSRISKSKQQHIRKAQKLGLATTFDLSIDEFLEFHRRSYKERGQNDLLDKWNCKRFIEEAQKNGQGTLVSTRDAEGKLLAVCFLVWDTEWGYYLWSGIDQSRRDEGAPALMIWDSLQFLKDKTKGFDFEGSMDEAIGTAYREYGSELVPFIHLHKYYSTVFKILDYLRGTGWKR